MLPAVSFSSTERIVINPILTLRAPLPPLQPELRANLWASLRATLWQGVQSEVVARVVAVFTSVFAATDALIHVTTGIGKGTCLLAKSICCQPWARYSSSTVYGHFRQAIWFSKLAAVGSIAGVIWPGIFTYCRYTPPSPSDFPDAPGSIKKLAEAVRKGQETFPFDQLKQIWRSSSLEDKHWIVQVFDHDGSARFKNVRAELANTVYQSRSHTNRRIEWLCPQEVDQRISRAWQKASFYSFFYHATSEVALKSILKSKKVEVRHEKAFRGAFVSTKPETGFGRCILAFKKNIERLSPLEHGFQLGNTTYWAGFSRDIPVSESTLSHIILDQGSDHECRALENRCEQWTGRSIAVLSLQEAEEHLSSVENLNMGIPAEWPGGHDDSSDNRAGQQIVNTLRARAVINAQQVALPARVSINVQQVVALPARVASMVQRVAQWARALIVGQQAVRVRLQPRVMMAY